MKRHAAHLSIGVLIALILLSAGCASDVANRYYADRQYPPKSPEQVEILYRKPTRAYEVIADFQSRGESPESVRNKAAKLGADAVIIATLGGEYRLSDEWAGKDSRANTYSRIVGTAIIYKN